MLKRLIFIAFGLSTLCAFSYATSCEDTFNNDSKSFIRLNFDDADLFIHIDKNNNNYKLETCTKDEHNTPLAMVCHILLPNGEDRNVSENGCEWNFEYSDDNISKVKLYIIVNGEYKTIEEEYNFDNGKRYWQPDASDTTPNKNQRIDIDIKAVDSDNDRISDYDGEVRFKVEKKSDYSRYTASYGNVTLNDLVRFTTDEGEFRLKVYDKNNSSVYEYIEFDLDNTYSSNIDGFSDKEYDQLKAIYKIRPGIIDQLEKDYRKLRYSTEREKESDDFYNNMAEIVNNDNQKTFKNYDDFFDTFLNRYSLTIETR